MATVNRLYEVVLQATYAGQEIVNRWNYLGTGDDGLSNPSVGLATALGAAEVGISFLIGTMFRHIQAIQMDSLAYNQCLIRSIYTPTDFVDIPFAVVKTGEVGVGAGLSPFTAIGFRSNRVRTDIGRGYKRFSGIPESAVGQLGVIDASVTTALTTIASDLGASISYTADTFTWNYHPVIVGKEKIVVAGHPTKYRYYATEILQAAHLASGITFEPYPVVRSQVSRQYGKGA